MTDYQRGLDTLREMLGDQQSQDVVARFGSLSPTFEREVVSVVFGRTWSRKGLDRRTRSLCSIGILAALGRAGALGINFDLARANGVTREEILEVLLQVGIYAGYPAALDALKVLAETDPSGDDRP